MYLVRRYLSLIKPKMIGEIVMSTTHPAQGSKSTNAGDGPLEVPVGRDPLMDFLRSKDSKLSLFGDSKVESDSKSEEKKN